MFPVSYSRFHMVALQCVIVAFPCYTQSLFDIVVAFISVFNSYEITFMSVMYDSKKPHRVSDVMKYLG